MDFELSEELKMIQSLARDFVADQLKPLERGLLGKAADLSDARAYLSEEDETRLTSMAKEMGLWGAGIPEELGGAGLGTLGSCLIEEEMAQTTIPFNLGDVTPVLFECNEAQKEKYFLPAFNREKQAYLAIMEPEKGADISAIQTKAEKSGNRYILNGRKLSFSRPGKDFFVVTFAVIPGSDGASEDATCFLVESNAPGLKVIGGTEAAGWHSQVQEPMLISFEKCAVAPKNILGEKGKAFSLGNKWMPARRVVRGARCIGAAQRLLEEAITRAQTWQSFGQMISSRPSIETALTDITTGIHACRLIVYEAAWKADAGKPIKHEAAMVKLMSTQLLQTTADRVAHIYNSPPNIAGMPMESFCRHALASSAADLSLELQRHVITRDLLKGIKV